MASLGREVDVNLAGPALIGREMVVNSGIWREGGLQGSQGVTRNFPHAGLGEMPSEDRLQDIPVVSRQPGDKSESAEAVVKFWETVLPAAGDSAKLGEKGVYVGEALPPVPQKLAEKIRAWEFVDMAELLPEFWAPKLEEKEGGQASSARRRRPVTELKTWLQGFAIYVAVMSGKHLGAVPQLMSFMVSIIRAAEDYAGLAWVRYDAAYRRQAVASGNRAWSQINPSLFSLCFTGKAQVANRCDLCLAATHTTRECSLALDGDPDLPTRMRAVESAVVVFANRGGAQTVDRRQSGSQRRLQDDICRVWNEKRCYFKRCRFRHACAACAGNHPMVDCPNGGTGGGPVRQPSQPPRPRGLPPLPGWEQGRQGRPPWN